MYRKPKNKDKNEFKLGHQIPLLEKYYPYCDNFDCMPCKMNGIASCFNMKTKFVKGCISKKAKPKTASPIDVDQILRCIYCVLIARCVGAYRALMAELVFRGLVLPLQDAYVSQYMRIKPKT